MNHLRSVCNLESWEASFYAQMENIFACRFMCYWLLSIQDYEHFFIVAEEKLSNLIPTGFLNPCESPRTPVLPSVPKPNIRNNVSLFIVSLLIMWETGKEQWCNNLIWMAKSSIISTLCHYSQVTPHQTSRVFSPFTPVTKRTPIPAGNSDTKDPRSVKRKRGMEYLSRLQKPAPLVPLGMVHSPRVSKTFNPPRRCETPRNLQTVPTPPPEEKQWVNDEELAMINTQTMLKR